MVGNICTKWQRNTDKAVDNLNLFPYGLLGIMYDKGRGKCTCIQMSSLLRQMCVWAFNERSDRENAKCFLGSALIYRSITL